MLILCIMFIGDKIVSCSFQVFYCDIKKVEMLYVVLGPILIIIAC